MKRLKLLVRHRARIDLTDIALHIAKFNETAAIRFLENAKADMQRLQTFPGIGPLYGFSEPDLQTLRFLPISRYRNYLIFYKADDQTLEIIRVLNGARDLPGPLRSEN